MGNRRRSQGIRVTYAFIKAHRREFDAAGKIKCTGSLFWLAVSAPVCLSDTSVQPSARTLFSDAMPGQARA